MFRRWRAASAVLAATAFLAAACTGTVSPSSTGSGGGGSSSGNQPHRGGTLTMLGQSDIFNLDTVSAYYTVSSMLERMFTRQLFSYGDPTGSATAAAGRARRRHHDPHHGQRRHHRRRQDRHAAHPPGVKWDTTPARQVTAADFVREFKMLCNPASPVGAPGYFTNTIVGHGGLLQRLRQGAGHRGRDRAYVNSHSLPGVVATNDLDADLPPAQLDAGLPVHPDHGLLLGPPGRVHEVRARQRPFRQHTLSDGPYEITSYVAGKSFTLARNPAWSAATDPHRHAYVNKITITEGLTQDNVQQQLVAGTGDMEWDVTPPAQDLPSLVHQHEPEPGHRPDGRRRRLDRAAAPT